MSFSSGEIAFTIAVATLVALVYVFYNVFVKKSSDSTQNEVEKQETNLNSDKNETTKQTKSKEKKQNFKPVKTKETALKHPWLCASLKAHSDIVTGIDFSSNGKYLISSGLDRAIFLWSTKEFGKPQHKNIRCNVEFDHAVRVKFSPDSKSFITGLGVANTLRAFKISKKDDSSVQIMPAAIQDFPSKHKADLINVGISSNAKFLMTCSRDTNVVIWDLKGDVLGVVDTLLMNNNFATVSTCGRFFGVCGFTSDVKVYEVCFDKSGNFTQIRRAFELKGHTAGVYNFSFNADSTRMASVSKDSTWKLWNTNIDYERGQEAKLLYTGNLEVKGPSLIAISPDSFSVAIVINNQLRFYDALNYNCDQIIDNVFNDSASEILFSNDNKYLALACDKQVKVFHNVTGHRVALSDLESSLKTAKTQGAKERIQQLIDEHKKAIDSIEQVS